MPSATVTAQPLNAAFCPADWQDVIDEFADKLSVTYTENDEVTISPSATPPADLDDLWIEKEVSEPFVGYAKIRADSQWIPIRVPTYYADTSVAADSIEISTGLSRTNAAYLSDRIFVIKVANTNTGAVSITVDGIASKALRKNNTDDLAAGEIVAGQLIEVAYDSAASQFEMLSPVVSTSTGIKAAVVREVQTAGTAATTVTGAGTTTIAINQETDPNNIVSINSSEFTPISGTYLVSVYVPMYSPDNLASGPTEVPVQAQLYNVTSGTVIENASMAAYDDNGATSSCSFATIITANGTDKYSIRAITTAASYRVYFGDAVNIGGLQEKFTSVSLLQLA